MRLTRNYIWRLLSAAIICPVALIFSGCATNSANPSASAADTATSTNSQSSIDPIRADPLLAGDRIEVDLNPGSGIAIQSVVSDIKGDGSISLPDVGRVDAAGKTPGELEKAIQDKYVPRLYTHINVTVTATQRYFFVGGEVNQSTGGRLPYTGPITVTQAIRAAGDFNPFAAKKKVQLRRSITGKTFTVNCVKAIDHPELDLPVYPGDTIFVPRRFW